MSDTSQQPAIRYYFVDEAGDPMLFNRKKLLVVGNASQFLDLERVIGMPGVWHSFVADEQLLLFEWESIGAGRQRRPRLVRLGLIPKGDARHEIITFDVTAACAIRERLRAFVLNLGPQRFLKCNRIWNVKPVGR